MLRDHPTAPFTGTAILDSRTARLAKERDRQRARRAALPVDIRRERYRAQAASYRARQGPEARAARQERERLHQIQHAATRAAAADALPVPHPPYPGLATDESMLKSLTAKQETTAPPRPSPPI